MWSCIHVDDASNAFVAAAEAGQSGVWHVVDDRAVSMAEFLRTFARAIGAPDPKQVPLWLAKPFVAKGTLSFLTASTRTSNAKIRRELGWAPRYPTIREGFHQVADVWAAEGFPRGGR